MPSLSLTGVFSRIDVFLRPKSDFFLMTLKKAKNYDDNGVSPSTGRPYRPTKPRADEYPSGPASLTQLGGKGGRQQVGFSSGEHDVNQGCIHHCQNIKITSSERR